MCHNYATHEKYIFILLLALFCKTNVTYNICVHIYIYTLSVSRSDILGPNGNLSDIKNLVSYEREMFEDSSYKNRKKSY